RRPPGKDRRQLAAQRHVAARVVGVARARAALEEVRAPDALAEVLPELALRGHEQHHAVAAAIVLIADGFRHAVVADRPPRPLAVAVVTRDLVLGALVGLVAFDAVPVERRGGIALRHLEPAAMARRARADDGGADAERGIQRARVDADGGVARDR